MWEKCSVSKKLNPSGKACYFIHTVAWLYAQGTQKRRIGPTDFIMNKSFLIPSLTLSPLRPPKPVLFLPVLDLLAIESNKSAFLLRSHGAREAEPFLSLCVIPSLLFSSLGKLHTWCSASWCMYRWLTTLEVPSWGIHQETRLSAGVSLDSRQNQGTWDFSRSPTAVSEKGSSFTQWVSSSSHRHPREPHSFWVCPHCVWAC